MIIEVLQSIQSPDSCMLPLVDVSSLLEMVSGSCTLPAFAAPTEAQGTFLDKPDRFLARREGVCIF